MSSSDARPIILVVEDEYFIAMEIAGEIEKNSARIAGPTGDVGEARQLAYDHHIDGALLDINLHGDFSYELARKMRASGQPFAFISGYGRETIPTEFADVPLVTKPYTPAQLTHVCDWILGEIRLRAKVEPRAG